MIVPRFDLMNAYMEDVEGGDFVRFEDYEKLEREVRNLRGALQDLRIRLHAQGRRPEECAEMSIIDDALMKEGK